MKVIRLPVGLLLLLLLQGFSLSVRAQGALVITGHDADLHHIVTHPSWHPTTEQFITACLDFLVFGAKASPAQVPKRAAVRIAYIYHVGRDTFNLVSGYTNPERFSVLVADWKRALSPGAFDVVIVGPSHDDTYGRYLYSAKTEVASYLNQGGKLFVNYQRTYSFLPNFGMQQVNLQIGANNFFITPGGDSLGLTDAMVNNDDVAHDQYSDVDTTLFKVFERSRETSGGWRNLPVTIGFRGRIQDNIFVPETGNTVRQPTSTVPSGPFTDSVCVEFFTPTDSAGLAYSLNGAITATSPTLANHGRLCFRQTTTISLIGKRTGWKDSPEATFTYTLNTKPPVIPPNPALSLFHRGLEISVVEASQKDLDIRLTLDSTEACMACPVLVFPSPGSDSESVLLTGGISPYQGSFQRELRSSAIRGDGTLQHGRLDSIVLLYRHPLDPARSVRRSYPFLPAPDTVAIRLQNSIAHTAGDRSITPGPQWIVSDAPGLLPGKQAGLGSCCSVASTPVNAQNPDSLRLVGMVIEATRGFSLDLKVFSHLGEFVHQVGFSVPESEFSKLTTVAGKDTRFLRLLWNGRTRDGSRAGNGAYIFKTAVTLLPASGTASAPVTASSFRRIGILRSPE